MQKIKVRKDVAEQVISKLKTPENSIKTAKNDVFKTEFAENLQNQDVKSEEKQVTSKLQANKNIFTRGDFDEYKISDEELKEHEYIEKSKAGLIAKIVQQRSKNGNYYNTIKWVKPFVENETKKNKGLITDVKSIYDTKKLINKIKDEIEHESDEDIISEKKEYINQLIKQNKEKENNIISVFPIFNKETQSDYKRRLNVIKKCLFIIGKRADPDKGFYTQSVIQDVKDFELQWGFDLSNTKHYYDSSFVNHSINKHGNAEKEKNLGQIAVVMENLTPKEIKDIEQHPDFVVGNISQKNKPSGGVITSIIYVKNKKNGVFLVEVITKGDKAIPKTMFIKNKRVKECELIGILQANCRNFDFSNSDTLKIKKANRRVIKSYLAESYGNGEVIKSSKKLASRNIISQKNNLSSKNVIKSLTITDKLFNLWVRRLSPELKKEMKKYVDESSKVYSLFSGFKNVYDIKGYPKGLDLENNILMELTDTYFIVACGGDWQDEKLVKFSIGDDDKLKAEVVDKCNKEDKRVLKKKLAYIISPSEITKSLTYSGYKLQGRTRLYGMDISIENKKGSYRSGVDKDGHKWRTYMNYDYGYIRGTVGTDKDHLDCYVGPDKEAQKVYIVHQNDPVTHKYDEDKCMLCFSSADAAKKAYMKQYDRPGFFGSMTTMTIDEFKSFIFSKKGKMIHKSFDIQITDITENNKQQKLEQFSKALNAIADNRQFVIKHIPADNSTRYENLTVRLMDFDRSKIEKAVHKVALSLDAGVLASSKGESFVYESQKEITEKFYKKVTDSARAVYNFVISYFDLPDIRIISKAGELKHKGKILYNPETGLPIKESEWKKFVVELEKFLNRNYSGVGEKIVLSAESLGIILDRLSKTNSLEAIRKMPLSTLKAKRYDVDWISDSIQNMKDKFGDVISRERQARIQIAMDSAAQRVTRVKDDMRNNIQQIIIDGIRDKQSKSVVAQNLFDKCASLNRDMQRIADSEVQMAANSAYCKEEVYNSKPDEKVYFKRFEMMDDNTCKQCKKLNGTIALWSDVPLPDEHIRDPYAKYAIWEGKNEGSCPIGIVHPYCRGSWIRYYPDIE